MANEQDTPTIKQIKDLNIILLSIYNQTTCKIIKSRYYWQKFFFTVFYPNMLVISVNSNNINSTYLKKKNPIRNSYNLNSVSFTNNQNDAYNISYLELPPRVLKAKAYLNSVEPDEGFDKYSTDVYKLNLNKLDGIQDGIKVFEGMNIKEIAFISRLVSSVNTMRGCYNKCSHCYANALAPLAENEGYISKMSWDDFKALTEGFKELHNRLGFYISAPNIKSTIYEERYIIPFHDSDSIDIIIKDKNGIEHDSIEIMNELSDSFGNKSMFDTTGWTPSNSKLQQRAERYIEYYSDPKNSEKLYRFNISINPFHALMTRSIMERRAGNNEKSEMFKELYTSRIANAIYSSTPLLNIGKLDFIARAFYKDYVGTAGNGFTMQDLQKLIDDILIKVKQKYLDDLKGEQKYITSYSQINSNMKELKKLINEELSYGVSLFGEGRSYEIFGYNNYVDATNDAIKLSNKKVKLYKSARNYIDLKKEDTFHGIIDANGKFYLTTYNATYPTELQFNFANKDKKTADIKPAMQENLVIKKSVINNI